MSSDTDKARVLTDCNKAQDFRVPRHPYIYYKDIEKVQVNIQKYDTVPKL